ncbi:hypothetical protein V6N11_072611 [Hibiscus sabdariffa]|uniref:Uncharacterized protein n=1 Tax=Hibiscus sabdariffa TaxID=183260 RepID=A0ABR2U3K1_9ROSI
MEVEIVEIKGKLDRVAFGALDKLEMLSSLHHHQHKTIGKRMVVEIVEIKGKLGNVTFGALDKLGMLGSRGSEPGFNTVGIVG